MARLAEVLPVLAQATRLAPTMRAWVKAAVMPLSLKLPEGFSPSYCSCRLPAWTPMCRASRSAVCSVVRPSPMVTMSSSVR